MNKHISPKVEVLHLPFVGAILQQGNKLDRHRCKSSNWEGARVYPYFIYDPFFLFPTTILYFRSPGPMEGNLSFSIKVICIPADRMQTRTTCIRIQWALAVKSKKPGIQIAFYICKKANLHTCHYSEAASGMEIGWRPGGSEGSWHCDLFSA